MTIMLGLGLGLLIGGLVVMWLSPSVRNSMLIEIVWYIGVILAVFGVVIIATPIMVWVHNQIHIMLGFDGGMQRLNR